MNLAQLIDEFAKLNAHKWADPRTAWGQCDASSYAFIKYARDNGYEGTLCTYTFYADEEETARYRNGGGDGEQDNPDPTVYKVYEKTGRRATLGNPLKNDVGVQMCTWHCIVDAGHILIDFTARQYRSHYAYPHIIAIGEKAMAAKAGA